MQAPDAVLVDSSGTIYITDTNSHKVWSIASGTVALVAGTGAIGTPSDGKAANTQPLNQPSGLAKDATGNLYIADRGSSRVFKVDTTGVITRIASLGNGRFTGDGRSALFSEINSPRGLTIGPDGNLYVADTSNNRIRKINLTTGIITTVAGGGNPCSAATSTGCTHAPSSYAPGDNSIGDGQPAVQAKLNAPEGLGFDSVGDLFIADTGNNRIRMIAGGPSPTAVITTVAGRDLTAAESAAGAKAPYAANCNNVKVTPGGTKMCVGIGDGRDPLQALLASPSQIWVDNNTSGPYFGGVFFSDRGNNIVRLLYTPSSPNGSSITSVIGTVSSGTTGDGGPPKSATINAPNGLSGDAADNLTFTDRGSNRVRQWNQASGVVVAIAGAATFNGDQTAKTTMFAAPVGVAYDAIGNVYVTDAGNQRIRKIDASGNVTTIIGNGKSCSYSSTNTCGDGGPAASGGVNNPTGIWVDPTGTTIVYMDTGNNRIRKISAGTGSLLAGGGSYTADGLPATTLSLNLNGSAGPSNSNIRKLPSITSADGGTTFIFTESSNNVVRKINADGTVVTLGGVFGVSGGEGDGGPATQALLAYPSGVAVNPNTSDVFVSDTNNHTVRVISNGIIYPVAGESGSSNNDGESSTNPAFTYRWRLPEGLAIDAAGKNLFICDTGNNKVDQLAISTLIATRIAGNNSNGGTTNEFAFDFAGDNVSGTSAQLSFPTACALGPNGNVIFTDSANNMLRVLIPASK